MDHPYWIHKCLNVGRISIPYYIFPDLYLQIILTHTRCMIENVNTPIDHNTIFIFFNVRIS